MITKSYKIKGTEDEQSKREFLTFMEKNFGQGRTYIIDGSRSYLQDSFEICIIEEKNNGFLLKIDKTGKGYYPLIKNKIKELEEKINSSGFNLREAR